MSLKHTQETASGTVVQVRSSQPDMRVFKNQGHPNMEPNGIPHIRTPR